jgi:hypothetical protein
MHLAVPEPVPALHVEGLSSYEPGGWWEFHEYRTDYVGHEVDRFFRTTKSAMSGTVTVGERVAKAMQLTFNSTTKDVETVNTNAGQPLTGGVPQDPIYARRRTLKENELKGIGYPYDTFTLFAPRTLKALYVGMKADEANKIPSLPYHETTKLISPRIVDDLVERIVGP